MRLQISLSDDKPTAEVAPAPQGFGGNYSKWLEKVSATKDFKEVKRLDNNKMVALDSAGNTIETFVIETDRKNLKVDTLDAKQTGTPADKTAQDVAVDPKLEKGA